MKWSHLMNNLFPVRVFFRGRVIFFKIIFYTYIYIYKKFKYSILSFGIIGHTVLNTAL